MIDVCSRKMRILLSPNPALDSNPCFFEILPQVEELDAVFNAQLLISAEEMAFDRLSGDEEGLLNLLLAFPGQDQDQDFALPRGDPEFSMSAAAGRCVSSAGYNRMAFR